MSPLSRRSTVKRISWSWPKLDTTNRVSRKTVLYRARKKAGSSFQSVFLWHWRAYTYQLAIHQYGAWTKMPTCLASGLPLFWKGDHVEPPLPLGWSWGQSVVKIIVVNQKTWSFLGRCWIYVMWTSVLYSHKVVFCEREKVKTRGSGTLTLR